MRKLHLSMLSLASAGLLLVGCGDSQKQVTGPAADAEMAPVLVAAPAAKTSATGWSAAGPGVVNLVSDGAAGDPEMNYALNGSSVFSTQTWAFSAVATSSGPITVNYRYEGFHAFFQVRAFLQAFVGPGAVTLVSTGPANCCSTPSAGFLYTGSHTFNVTAGQTYGFRFGGSNFDSDSRLLGTFSLPGYTPPPPPPDLTAPVITLNGPASQVLECHVGTYTELGATATDDRDGAVAVTTSGSVNTLAEGTYTLTYTARDAAGNTASATRTVKVVDTTPPAITLNGAADLTLECHVATYTEAGATALDACDGAVTVSLDGTVDTTIEGEYTLTYTATDAAGNTSTATRTVEVVDTTAPSLTLALSQTSLWPPNHAMVPVATITATDLCDALVDLQISVSSNEPENGTGDGDTGPDWEVVKNGDGTASIALRAERKGNGTGRVYTLSVVATDEAGNTTVKGGKVSVAHSQAKKK